jgi:hypothetical protein
MGDFTILSRQGSKNGSAVHPFFKNARPISNFFITPKKNQKNKKIGKTGAAKGAACSLSNYMSWPMGDQRSPADLVQVP